MNEGIYPIAIFVDGVQYLQAAEREIAMPSLFDDLECNDAVA